MKNFKMPKLKPALERKIHSMKRLKGRFAAVEPRSGKWFIGKSDLDALLKGKEEIPQGLFYILKIGYKVAGMMKKINR